MAGPDWSLSCSQGICKNVALALSFSSVGSFLGVAVITLFCSLMVRKCQNGFKVICGSTHLEIGEICFKLDSVFTNYFEEI